MLLRDMQSGADLVAALRNVDISVPARTGGRKTHHTETYIACRLLSTLAADGQLVFPLSVSCRDRPDVVMFAGEIRIGIEITEAIPAKFAELCALAEREFPGRWLPVDVFPWDKATLTQDEMRALLRENTPAGSGWIGDEAEREWARFMQKVVENKLTKLGRPDFKKFDQNWLSVYDNLPIPNIHLANAIGILRPFLKDCWERVPAFDTVFIEHGPVIARITADGSEHLAVTDLWQSG